MYRSSPIFLAIFSMVKLMYILTLKKMCCAAFWAIFFTNSSGHLAPRTHPLEIGSPELKTRRFVHAEIASVYMPL
jgi:hypothetical protein